MLTDWIRLNLLEELELIIVLAISWKREKNYICDCVNCLLIFLIVW